MKKVLIISVVFLLSFFLLAYRITEVPPGINGDEAAIGYQAFLIAKNNVDENGKFLPLFTRTPGSSDWRQPVFFYTASALFKLFNTSYELFRTTSVLFTILALATLFILVNEILGVKAAIASTFLFITTPIVMIHSHLAMETIAPIPFVIFWLFMMVRYTKSNQSKFLLFGGISLGLGIFSYNGMRLIVPALSIITLTYLFFLKAGNISKIITPFSTFLFGLIPFLVLLFMSKSEYPGAAFGNNRPTSPTSYQEFFLRYLSIYDFSFLFLKGDATPYHSTGKAGMFLLATLPLFLIGTFASLKSRNKILILTVASFFLSPLLYGLVPAVFRASRLLVLTPFFVILATVGFRQILMIKSKILGRLIIVIAVLLIVLNYYDFVRDYWFDYPERVRAEFATPVHLVFRIMRDKSQDNNFNLYIEEGIYRKEMAAVKFFKEVYLPEKELKRWDTVSTIPGKSLIIVNPDILTGEKSRGFSELTPEKIGFYKLYVKE